MDVLQRLLLAIGLTAGLIVVRLACRRHPRGLASPPTRLPLAAIVAWLLSSSLPLVWLPEALRPWWSTSAVLLISYALISLGEWACLELPAAVGLWAKPPKILRDLGILAVGAAFTVVVLQQQARVNLVGLVTTSAVLTAVIGLAAQETLKDLFAGITLQMDNPFREGDWIELDGTKGIVVSLTLMNTLLRSVDGTLHVLPNSKVASEVLHRFREGEPVGNRFSLGLDYGFPPAQARELLLQVIRRHPLVLSSEESRVWVGAYADSSITYELLVWQRGVGDLSRLQLRSELLEQFWYALQRAGQSIPYPVRELRRKPSPAVEADHALASLDERQRLLRSNHLFAVLGEQQLGTLAALSQSRSFGPGETIVREGEAGDSLYQLVRGRVEVLKTSADGTPTTVARLEAGEIFGEMTLCLDAPRSATVRSLEECRLLEVSRAALQPLLANDTALLKQLAGLVNARRAQLQRLEDEATPLQDKQLFERMRELFSSLLG
ncbi:mechanosensitive ion channel family protein [Cyanobium sp. Morenito 9A2]|uniref:mechanosensitive ion channel family protein n=1 Tax=Cyanobium sp. Morenito 9A2 TaxID=2823718 RepID=UPI0020CBE2FF|nr:mechanosensitive ion channel family protein [Cyanobium sp. Morenito 9A2]MCP9851212.1 mechanosensitive ion channel [Cyanobium sp. Morenito 9A2]